MRCCFLGLPQMKTLIWVMVFGLLVSACGPQQTPQGGTISPGSETQSTQTMDQAVTILSTKPVEGENLTVLTATPEVSGGIPSSTPMLTATSTIPMPPSGDWMITSKTASQVEQLLEVKPAQIGVPVDLTWSPDGSFLAVAGPGGLVLLDGETFELVRKLDASSAFTRVVFSADGKRIAATGQSTGVSQVWDVEGNVIQTIPDSGSISALSPDGKTLAVIEDVLHVSDAGDAGTLETILKRYNLDTGVLMGETSKSMALAWWMDYSLETIGVLFSPDGRSLQTINSLGDVRLWDSVSGKMLSESLNAYTRERLSFGYCMVDDSGNAGFGILCHITYHDPPCSEEDINCIFEVKGRYELGFWDARQIRRMRNLVISDPRVLYKDARVVPENGKALLMAEDRLEIWNASRPQAAERVFEGSTLPKWMVETQSCEDCPIPILAVKPNSSGQVVATAFMGRIVLWDSMNNQELAEWNHDTRLATAASLGVVDAWPALAVGYSDGSLSVSDGKNGEMITSQDGVDTRSVLHIALAPDGETLISARENGLEWWSLTDPSPWRKDDFYKNDIFNLNLAKGFLVTSLSKFDAEGYYTGKTLQVREALSGDVKDLLEDEATDAAVSLDGRWMATSSLGMIRIYEVESGKLLHATPLQEDFTSTRDIDLSPDGSQVSISVTDGTLLVIDVNTHAVWYEGVFTSPLQQAIFHPSGCLLAAGDSSGVIHILDLSSRQVISRWVAHSGTVKELAFSQDGRLLMSVGGDGAARLWGQPGVLNLPSGVMPETRCQFAEVPHAITPAAPTGTPTLSPPTPTPTLVPLTRSLLLTDPYLRGPDVLQLQQRLYELGYTQVGIPDGVFGPMTDAAVRQYQERNGLVVDGIIGINTWNRLFGVQP